MQNTFSKYSIPVSPSDFPLRASLFYKAPNGQPGSTWNYFAKDTANEVTWMQNKQIAYKSNAMTFIVFNMDAHPVNPFVGSPTAAQVMAGQNQVDMNEVNRWKSLIQFGTDPHIYLIPCLFCGDDRGTTNNTAFHDYFVPAAIQFFNPYSKAFIISTEASKSMNNDQMERLITVCKNSMALNPKPVGVHLQWNRKTPLPRNLDFLVYEFSWNPWNGNDHSISEVISEAQDVINHCGIPVWFQEMNIYPESTRAKKQARALKIHFPSIAGLPGPTE